MPCVFAYGSLQGEDVQTRTYGRLLIGEPDYAVGFVLGRVGPHNSARHTGRPEGRVDGTAFDLTEAELAATDEYERRDDYVRRPLTLASGASAWIYVHHSDQEA